MLSMLSRSSIQPVLSQDSSCLAFLADCKACTFNGSQMTDIGLLEGLGRRTKEQ